MPDQLPPGLPPGYDAVTSEQAAAIGAQPSPPPGYDVVHEPPQAPPPGYDVVHEPPPATPPPGYDVVHEPPPPTEEQPKPPGFWSSAYAESWRKLAHAGLTGVKESLAPTALTTEELKGPHTGAEAAASMAARFGTDVGLPIAVGAAVGSPGGPLGVLAGAGVGTAAAIGMGLYRGLGYEYAMAKAEHRDFDPLKGTVNAVTEAVPFVKQGGKMIHALVMGTSVGARVHQYAEPGSDASSSVLSGLGAAALTALLRHPPTKIGAAVDEAIAADSSVKPSTLGGKAGVPESVEALRTATSTADTLGSESRINEILNKIPDAELFHAPETLEQLSPEFLDWKLNQAGAKYDPYQVSRRITKDDAAYDGTITEAAQAYWDKSTGVNKTTGLRPVDEDWYLFNRSKAVYQTNLEIAEQEAVKLTESANPAEVLKAEKDPLGFKLFRMFGDLSTVADRIDAVLGSDFAGMLRAFATAKNDFSAAAAPFYRQAGKLVAMGEKAGVSRVKIGQAIESEAVYSAMKPEQQLVVDYWRDLFHTVRDFMGAKGLTVGDLGEQYLTQVQLPAVQRNAQLRRALQAFREEAPEGNIFATKVADDGTVSHALNGTRVEVGGKELNFMEFKLAVAHQLGVPVEDVSTMAQVAEALKTSLDPTRRQLNRFQTKGTSALEASATFERTGDIPAFIQDTDVGRVFNSYLNGNFKSIYFNPAMRMLDVHMPLLEARGWTQSADWMRTFMSDMRGEQSTFRAWANTKINTYKASIQARVDAGELSQKAGDSRALVVDFASWCSGLVYHNYLGGNFRSALRDLTKPLALTAPEIGGAYGYEVTARGTIAMAMKRYAQDGEDPISRLGLKPTGYHKERQLLDVASVYDAGATGKLARASDKMGEVGMLMYDKSDSLNRLISYNTAQEWAKDIVAGRQSALDALAKSNVGIRTEIEQLVNTGKAGRQEIGDKLAVYLNEKTQFNYGREAMNEFGREYGRFFSAFTKWPVMVGSDMYALVQDRRFGKFAAKYVAPFAALAAADNWLKDTDKDPVSRYVIGKSLASWHPTDAVLGFQGFENSPVLEAGKGVVKTLTEALTADWTDHAPEAASKIGGHVYRSVNGFLPFMFIPNRVKSIYDAVNPER